jgi:glycosyltransferase involved in cell wall biosynthesis
MRAEHSPSCALVISTYNWPIALNLCLRSVFRQTLMPKEIIVADDGSRSDTKELIDSLSQEFRFPIKHCWQEDKGFRLSRSRNNAILASTSDYLIFIDCDILLHKHFVKDHLTYAQDGMFVNGSRVLLAKNLTEKLCAGELKKVGLHFIFSKNIISGFRLPFLHRFIVGPQYTIKRIKGCNMAFWRSDLLQTNGFDESYEGWGREDSDIVARLLNLGVKRKNLKWAAVCFHLFHKQQSRDSLMNNDALLQFVIDNKAIVARKGIKELRNNG